MNPPFFVLVLAFLLSTGRGATLVLPVLQDTWLDEMPLDAEEQNGLAAGGTYQLMVGRVGENDATPLRRSLIQFDLSTIPSGAVIRNAFVSLYAFKVKYYDEVPVTLQRVTSGWVAGTYNSGGSGHSSGMNPGDATWLNTSSPAAWNTPGGDFIGAPSATAIVGETGLYSWSSSQLTADVQAWIDGAAENFGWIVRGDEVTPHMVKEFASMDYFDSDLSPTLTIDFITVPEPTDLALAPIGAWVVLLRRRPRSR